MSTQIQGCAPSLTHARAPTSSGACLRAKHRPLQALGSHSPPGSHVRQHCDDRPPNREEGLRRGSARPHTCTLARAAVLPRAVPRMLPPRSTSSPPAGTHKRRAGPQGGLRANGSLMTWFFILLPPPTPFSVQLPEGSSSSSGPEKHCASPVWRPLVIRKGCVGGPWALGWGWCRGSGGAAMPPETRGLAIKSRKLVWIRKVVIPRKVQRKALKRGTGGHLKTLS